MTALPTGGVKWTALPSSLVGIADGKSYPLYLQSHAIHNLYKRSFGYPGAMAYSMYESLSCPKVVQNHRGDYLLEVRYSGLKLGYFIIEFSQEYVLATTFLFLTMQGTPQWPPLYEQLRSSRPDIEHLGLDSLDNFMFADLQGDKELVAILEGCDCGDLLKMAEVGPPPGPNLNLASTLRQYLGMNVA